MGLSLGFQFIRSEAVLPQSKQRATGKKEKEDFLAPYGMLRAFLCSCKFSGVLWLNASHKSRDPVLFQ